MHQHQIDELSPDSSVADHTHHHRRPWQVAAVFVCPCHVPILLAVLGTSALGGALSRNIFPLFVGLTMAFVFALWRGFAAAEEADACPVCKRADVAASTSDGGDARGSAPSTGC